MNHHQNTLKKIKIYADFRLALIIGITFPICSIYAFYEDQFLYGFICVLFSVPTLLTLIHPKFSYIKPGSAEHQKALEEEKQNPGDYLFNQKGLTYKFNPEKHYPWTAIQYIRAYCYDGNEDEEVELEIDFDNGDHIAIANYSAQHVFFENFLKYVQPTNFNRQWYKDIVKPHFIKTQNNNSFIKLFLPKYYPEKPIIYSRDTITNNI